MIKSPLFLITGIRTDRQTRPNKRCSVQQVCRKQRSITSFNNKDDEIS